MPKGEVIAPLREWRTRHGFTMEQAGAAIVVEGRRTNRGTYHAWETGKKLPKEPFMYELERVTGAEPNDFYRRPDAGDVHREEPAQGELV